MRKTASYSLEENLADARQLAECMYRLYTLPQPTIARVNGAAIGGGMGLVCACDLAIAQEDATFSLSEVKIGLVPACISPYVLKKVGEGRCREFFLTGERLSAQRAKEAGLVNEVVSAEELDARLQERVNLLLANGPQALATCKSLLAAVSQLPLEEARDYTAHVISELRLGQEAQEGMAAFLEKRRPSWLKQ
jgi:methylglutaconyl-CoA hydratase